MEKVIAIGNFDGVHIAHQKLLSLCAAEAKKRNLKSAAYVFETHPAFLLGRKDFSIITSNEVKKREILKTGIDEVVFEKTTREILSKTPEQFVCEILKEKLGAVCVFAGYNYTFGKGGAGDSNLLKKICSQYGIDAVIMENETLSGEEISSSRIRDYLLKGDTRGAARLLGREHSFEGIVQKGKKLGRVIGFKTANVHFEKGILVPENGVYRTKTTVFGKEYKSVTNVGTNPTFENIPPRLESHIIDFDMDIYGENIKVDFYEKIRDEVCFSGIEELKKQIEKDKSYVINN